jgi:glutamine cyclotransferase
MGTLRCPCGFDDGNLILKQHTLPSNYFAQGLTYVPRMNNTAKGRLVQLTWQEQKGFLYDSYTLDPLGRFQYTASTKLGWGIAYQGSDHTSVGDGWFVLAPYIERGHIERNIATHKILKRQAGSTATIPLAKVHELEWDIHSGSLLGIVSGKDTFVRANPDTGLVTNVYCTIYRRSSRIAAPDVSLRTPLTRQRHSPALLERLKSHPARSYCCKTPSTTVLRCDSATGRQR